MNQPTLIVSLDFELFWGMQDGWELSEYEANILGGRKAIPQMLELFQKHGIAFPALKSEMRVNLCFSCMYHYQQALMWLEDSEIAKTYEYIYTIIRTNSLRKHDRKLLSLKHKAWVVCSSIAFRATCKIRNYLGIGT